MIGIEQPAVARRAAGPSLGKRWEKLLHHPAVLPFIGFAVLFVLMSLLNDSFLSVNNLTNVARRVDQCHHRGGHDLRHPDRRHRSRWGR